ncbi:helix-turn-helix transcriptional regulator [Streptomyces sparsogenes]|uniref:helix-turn-helix domain-containing protein n=1 Tax=Streptomyces sparsogenes TaxID=67365 RepID=UPI00332FCBDE
MAHTAAPSARRRRLGAELRKMREHAGMTVAYAAQQLGAEGSRVSNIEAGRLGVSEERVRMLAAIYSCGDQAYIDALAAMATERGRGWWEDYRERMAVDALDLAELESHAVSLRAVQIMHVPGLLQTEDYANAVFSTAEPALTPAQLRVNVSFRLRRREVLDRDDLPQFTFLIHEAALRMEWGGPKVARGQLERLLEASEWDNVTVRAIPFAAGGFPHAGASAAYVRGVVPQLDTVQLDTPTGVTFLDGETHLANYRRILDRTERLALAPEDTRAFIQAIAQRL